MKQKNKILVLSIVVWSLLLVVFNTAVSVGKKYEWYRGAVSLKTEAVLARESVDISSDICNHEGERDTQVSARVPMDRTCDRLTIFIYNIKNRQERIRINNILKNELLTIPQYASFCNDQIDIYITYFPEPFSAYTSEEKEGHLRTDNVIPLTEDINEESFGVRLVKTVFAFMEKIALIIIIVPSLFFVVGVLLGLTGLKFLISKYWNKH